MSRTNIETVKRFYDFWIDRDYEAVAELIDPDAVMDVSRNVFNPGVHRGIDGFRGFVEQIDEMWDDFQVTPEELIDGGDTIVVSHRIVGKGRGSGVETALVRYGVVTLRQGKVLRFVGGIDDRREALDVAGLSEQAMSQENERTILALVAALNRGDWDAALGYATPDLKYDTTRDLNDTRGLYETHEDVKRTLERFYGSWESWHGEVTEFTHVDETLVVTRETGHVRGRDGIEVMARTSSVWRFRDGRISEYVHYREEDDARKAVGLSE